MRKPISVSMSKKRRYDRSRSEEHTSELQSHLNLVCRLLLEKKKKKRYAHPHTTFRARLTHHTTYDPTDPTPTQDPLCHQPPAPSPNHTIPLTRPGPHRQHP